MDCKSGAPPKRPFSSVIWFVSAITLMDVLYALIAFWGYYRYLRDSVFINGLGLAIAIGLMAMGCYELYDSKKQLKTTQATVSPVTPHTPIKTLGDFLMGILLGANPAFILYWLAVARICDGFGIHHLETGTALVICLGVVLGDVLWYGGLIMLLERGLHLISNAFIVYLRGIIGLGFVAFGLALIYKMLLIR
ncbi:MAG: LysE family transporter [Nitrospiria bacterium]